MGITSESLIIDKEDLIYRNRKNNKNFVEVAAIGGGNYVAVFYVDELVRNYHINEISFIEIKFGARSFSNMLHFVKQLFTVVVENYYIFSLILKWLQDYSQIPGINIYLLAINDVEGYECIDSYDFTQDKKEGKGEDMSDEKYDIDVLTRETGEFVCSVQVDDNVVHALVERGFQAVLEDQIKAHSPMYEIKRVIFNEPATIILWENGDKTVVKTMKDDVYQPEVGFAMAYMKRLFGSRSQFMKYVEEWWNPDASLPVCPTEDCENLTEHHDEYLYDGKQMQFEFEVDNVQMDVEQLTNDDAIKKFRVSGELV